MTTEPVAPSDFDHDHCLVCGNRNPLSLGLRFEQRPDGSVHAQWQGHFGLQGYAGILHGGVIATLLDAAMTHCLFAAGIRAVTAEMQLRYLRPVPYDSPLELTARITEKLAPLYRLQASLGREQENLASASAAFLQKTKDNR